LGEPNMPPHAAPILLGSRAANPTYEIREPVPFASPAPREGQEVLLFREKGARF